MKNSSLLILLVLGAACAGKSVPTAPPSSAPTRTYVAFGDSVTLGVQHDGTTQTSWGEMLSRKIDAPIRVEAVAGERVQDARQRLASALVQRPDALLLMHGYNDLAESGAVDALRELVRLARTQGVSVYLATLAPINAQGYRGWNAECVAPFNEQIRRIARDEGATLVDVTIGWQTAYQGEDGLHPNLAGQNHIAQAFAGAIR